MVSLRTEVQEKIKVHNFTRQPTLLQLSYHLRPLLLAVLFYSDKRQSGLKNNSQSIIENITM
jgi:hypothetical protein